MSPASLEDSLAGRGPLERLPREEAAALAASFLPGWSLGPAGCLRRELRFPDFLQALACLNRVAAEAEARAHHPDCELGWGRLALSLTTHDAGGLTRQDLLLAAALEPLFSPREATA